MEREEFSGQDTETRGYSDAVATAGGKIVWIAGVGRYKDEAGAPLAGNFEEQVRASSPSSAEFSKRRAESSKTS